MRFQDGAIKTLEFGLNFTTLPAVVTTGESKLPNDAFDHGIWG